MLKSNRPKVAKKLIIFLVVFLFAGTFPVGVSAVTSNVINFQGKIVRNDTGYEGLNVVAGTPSCVVAGAGNDTCDFRIRYYDALTSGTLLLTETFSNTEIGAYNGAFDLSLGSTTPTAGSYATFDAMIKGEDAIYVELGFDPAGGGSFTETFTRMPLGASAFAIRAKYAAQASSAFQFDTAADGTGYSTPSEGMVFYDSDDDVLMVYDGASWVEVGGGGTGSLFTDGGIFTYLTSLTDHFVLGSSSYTAIGSDSYATYLSGLGARSPFSFDMTAERLTLSGSSVRSGLTVYSDYNSTGAWPVVSFKAEDSGFDNVVLEITQDGTGNLMSLKKGSTDAFVFENALTMYVRQRPDAPATTVDRLYNINGTLYWNGSPVSTSGSLWTDGGTFTYLTSTTDDVIIGGNSAGTAKFFFDVSTGNLGIGTSTPGAKLDIAGASSVISNTTGDITITPDDTVVIKANDTQADNLTEWQNSSATVLSLINQNGYATFGKATGNTGAMLTLGANTTTVAQVNFNASAAVNVTAPVSGDMWWNGTSLYFYNGSANENLLNSVKIAPAVAQVDAGTSTNSIWINKTGTGGNLIRMQKSGSDMLVVDSAGNTTLGGGSVANVTLTLGAGTGYQGAIRHNATSDRLEFYINGVWIPLGDYTNTVTLSAEYPGAVLSADGTSNVGVMTSDSAGTASDSMNYYEWSSSATSLNDYDVRVRFTLPSDFSSWGSGWVLFNYATEATGTTNNKLDFYVYEESSATVDGSSTGQASSSAGVWKTTTIAGSGLNECTGPGTTCMFIIKMSSANDSYVRVGDIDINYNRQL